MHLILNNITKSYHSKAGHKRKILDQLSLQVEKGETISVAGPSGSGKTTLLNIIGTLDKPDSGEVLIHDENVNSFSKEALALFRNQKIGFIFQRHHLLPQCTLLENILIPTIPLKEASLKKESTQRANDLLKRVGIWEQRHQKPGELSGGECQRAAVVRALINAPGLLLADEPTGSLDQKNSDILADLLFDLNRIDQITLILVTHDNNLAARAKKQFLLSEGKLSR